MSKVVLGPKLVVAIAEIIGRVWWARILEASGMPVLVNGMVEFTKVQLGVISVFVLE